MGKWQDRIAKARYEAKKDGKELVSVHLPDEEYEEFKRELPPMHYVSAGISPVVLYMGVRIKRGCEFYCEVSQ